jgi:hypothetical protein
MESSEFFGQEGTCIAHVPNGEGIFGMSTLYGDLTHVQAFTRRSAEQTFRAVGFHSVTCFEDRPIPHGLKSLARRILWNVGKMPLLMLHAAESGHFSAILSQNMLVCSKK